MDDFEYEKFVQGLASIISNIDNTTANTMLVAYSYGLELKYGIHINGTPDLEVPRAKDRYNSVIKYIEKVNPTEYFVHNFNSQNKDDVILSVYNILCSIFGESNQLTEEYNYFLRNIIINGSQDALNGYSYKTSIPNIGDSYRIEVPTLTNMSAIACVLHEFVHFHFLKHNISFDKAYYDEILSILFEKIAADYVETNLHDNEYVKKIENNRLECIRYHHTIKKQDTLEIHSMIEMLSSGTTKNQMHAKRLLTDYENYSNRLALAYGLGYIYAENLFILYKTDPISFKKEMIKIFNGQVTLQDTLNYYGINTERKEVFERTKIKIKQVTRK